MPSLTQNANYLVSVTKGATSSPGGTGGNTVTANAMAKMQLEIQNHWVDILEALGLQGGGSAGLIGQVAGSVAAGAQIFTGNNFLPKILTSKIWRGSTGFQLSLQMRFDAWDDPVADVLTPVQKLIAMFSPIRGGGAGDAAAQGIISAVAGKFGIDSGSLGSDFFLHPPGPTTVEYVKGDKSNQFIVSLGNVMVIQNLIPTTIQWEFEERFDKSGNPMAAMVTLGFISFTTPDQTEILSFFKNNTVTSAIGNGNLGSQATAS